MFMSSTGSNLDQQYMNGPNAIPPDGFTFRVGVTTVVDAGCAGWRTFPEFKRQTIDISQTRVLAFLNIVGEGMRGGPFEQNQKDMDPKLTAEFALKNSKDIVGIKLAHYSGRDWTPVRLAEEAARLSNMPLMVDLGGATSGPVARHSFYAGFPPGRYLHPLLCPARSQQAKPCGSRYRKGITLCLGSPEKRDHF